MHHDYIRRNVSSSGDIITEFDLHGQPLATHRNLVVYHELLEAYATYTCEPKDIIINSTEGGLRIKGTKEMALKNAIEEYCDRPIGFSQTLASIFLSKQETKVEGLIPAMEELIVNFREMEKICLRGGEISSRLQELLKLDGKSDESVDNLIGEMDRIDLEIKSKGQAVEMLEEMTQRVLFRVMRVHGSYRQEKTDPGRSE